MQFEYTEIAKMARIRREHTLDVIFNNECKIEDLSRRRAASSG